MSSRNICTSQLGPDHSNTLTVTANLAACLAAQGRHAEAHPLYEAELEVGGGRGEGGGKGWGCLGAGAGGEEGDAG